MRRFVALLALLAVTAAGCGDDERAGSLPTSSTTPSATSTTSTPSPSATPATHDARVAAAARDYFALLERAGQQGDVAALDPHIGSGCSCREQVEFLRREAAARHRITTRYVVESVAVQNATATGGTAAVTFSTPASQILDAAGKQVRAIPAVNSAGLELTFRMTDSTWVLERLVRL